VRHLIGRAALAASAALVVAGVLRPAAPIASAPAVAVEFTEWLTPSTPPYPHDPAYAPDGSVWYTGQRANVIGRLDPATGAFKEWPLPTPNSGPHGITADKAGNIWYTGNSAALIGKLDPKTGKIVEYKMPDARARDPHTPIVDEDGLLYFTVQGGNFVGRLNPADGAIVLKPPPTANSRPYGIARSSTGLFYFDEFNANRIGELNPKTMAIKEYPLPNPAARPRRIAIDSHDFVYYSDYARGFLGRLDPRTGRVEEFASPGGPTSRPYAIVVTTGDVVWYCETGVDDKNVLVRFDPATKQMQTWPIPSGGHTVRNMVVGRPNELWLAESGNGKIARASIR
jgi:virginiamycin B lyase